MKIFISYAHQDRNVAAQLANQLSEKGFDVWWDASLIGGDRYRATIQSELDNAEKILVLWSLNSVNSDFVMDEANYAIKQGKLIPITIDGSEPPLGFRSFQTISSDAFAPNISAISNALSNSRSQLSSRGTGTTDPGESAFQEALSIGSLSNPLATIEKFGTAYAQWLLTMIVRPMAMASAMESMRNQSERVKFVLTVIAISVAIGATLGGSIPGRPPLAGRLQILVVVSCVWLFWAILIHLFCKLFGGKGEATTTILVTLQTLAFTYLVSNFLTFMLWNLRGFYSHLDAALNAAGLETPGTALILFQAALLLPLIPLTLGRAHVFSSAIMGACVALLAALLAGITAAPIVVAGGC